MLVQSSAQIDIGGLKLAKQRAPQQFETIKGTGIHGLFSTSGCLVERLV
jgi:hypothetical protein